MIRAFAIYFLLMVFAGCIDVPIESIEDRLDGVDSRQYISQREIRDCLLDSGVSEELDNATFYDRTFYRCYSMAEMKAVLNSQVWIRQLEYNRYNRNCTDFAIMFLAVCRTLMPAAPLGTIEYLPSYEAPLIGYQLYGHKVVLFFHKNYLGELVCVLVDPRNKKIERLKDLDIWIHEIDM